MKNSWSISLNIANGSVFTSPKNCINCMVVRWCEWHSHTKSSCQCVEHLFARTFAEFTHAVAMSQSVSPTHSGPTFWKDCFQSVSEHDSVYTHNTAHRWTVCLCASLCVWSRPVIEKHTVAPSHDHFIGIALCDMYHNWGTHHDYRFCVRLFHFFFFCLSLLDRPMWARDKNLRFKWKKRKTTNFECKNIRDLSRWQ